MALTCAIIGASGYTGAELAVMITRHPQLQLAGLYVSAGSSDAGKPLASLHRTLLGVVDGVLEPLADDAVEQVASRAQIVFLATEHKVSHDYAPRLLAAGATVFDLSAAFRFNDAAPYSAHYGFDHQFPELLNEAVYGLVEWNADAIKGARLIAVAGCYPTASLLALKPLEAAGLIAPGFVPAINAVSGVSGAGRKATLTNSFCEVSYNPYGVLAHRHQPEISRHLGRPVVFTPHLGNFPRGIVATIAVQLAAGTTAAQVDAAYAAAYTGKPCVRLYNQLCPGSWPSINAVVKTPFCDLGWKVDEALGHVVVVSAIDNLLKGASSQAIQCVNMRFGLTNYPLVEA